MPVSPPISEQSTGQAPSSPAIRLSQTPCPAGWQWTSSRPSPRASMVTLSIGLGPKTAIRPLGFSMAAA